MQIQPLITVKITFRGSKGLTVFGWSSVMIDSSKSRTKETVIHDSFLPIMTLILIIVEVASVDKNPLFLARGYPGEWHACVQ